VSPDREREPRRPVIDAIISARDEAPTVAGVASACLAAAVIREVIVVDDGSIDDTAALAAAAGAKVVTCQGGEGIGQPGDGADRPARRALVGMVRRALGSRALGSRALGSRALGSRALGSRALGSRASADGPVPCHHRSRRPGSKAAAMAAGVAVSDAEAFLFLDADLLGLSATHLERLCQPIIDGSADMSVGWLDYGWWNPLVLRLPPSTGERVVPRWVFEAVPAWRREGYKMEILLNEVIAEARARSAACTLEGVRHRTKRDKLGPVEGRRQTWQMFWTLAGMPMTGEVRWRTFWLYWQGLTVRPGRRS
jgi:glycosyltransferase involved in cell wall biosynthesis